VLPVTPWLLEEAAQADTARCSAGYRPITTCSAHNFDYVASLGAEKAFNYNDSDCGEQIRKYTNNKLKYAWDCISLEPTPQICAGALTSEPGAKYASLLRAECPRSDVESMATLAYSAFGEAIDKGFAKSDGSQEDFDFAAKTWVPIAEKCLLEGKIKVHNPRVGSGLENVLDGLEQLKNNKVSGEKLVYKL
jgi:NADPH:quinone reductase-like Zn-dependent oxidoreductase